VVNFDTEDAVFLLTEVERPARKRIDSADRAWGSEGTRSPERIERTIDQTAEDLGRR
jgi:hypothetical protein